MELVGDDGSILLVFQAKSVNIVAGSENNSTAFVFLDTEFLHEKNNGSDIVLQNGKSIANINEFRLYNLACL